MESKTKWKQERESPFFLSLMQHGMYALCTVHLYCTYVLYYIQVRSRSATLSFPREIISWASDFPSTSTCLQNLKERAFLFPCWLSYINILISSSSWSMCQLWQDPPRFNFRAFQNFPPLPPKLALEVRYKQLAGGWAGASGPLMFCCRWGQTKPCLN